jgi:hypothetical protein
MKKRIERLEDVFGKKLPSVELFDKILSEMPEKEAIKLRKEMYRFSFNHWNEMSPLHQMFFDKLFTRDRDTFLNFLLNDTPLGILRYELQLPKLLIKVLHLLELPKKGTGKRLSFRHLAFSLSLSFCYNLSLSTLADYLSERNPDTTEILYLAGKIPIEDTY